MADAKIEFRLGSVVEFKGEGEKEWVADQLDKILEKAPQLAAMKAIVLDDKLEDGKTPMGSDPLIAGMPLGTFLQGKNATSNNVKKFLATAVWLEAKGKKLLKTHDVTQALSDNRQGRLSNAADSLNKNVSKGNCEKKGSEFFVTEPGKKSL